MALLEQIESKAFLGEEFLTWLLWRGATRDGLIGVDDIEVHLGGAIQLAAPFGEAEEVALKGESPAESRELFTALREGKTVARAQMRWVIDGIEWSVTVRGATLALAGLRPPLRAAPPDAEWIERRLELMDGFAEAFERTYETFIALRLDDRAWKKEADAMSAWIADAAPERRAAPVPEAPEVIEVTDPEA